MDMRKHLPATWLNATSLAAMEDQRFEGIIEDVVEEEIKNRFKGFEKNEKPIIIFGTGHKLVLNTSLLRQLIEWFGADSTAWHGRRLIVHLGGINGRHKRVMRSEADVTTFRARGVAR